MKKLIYQGSVKDIYKIADNKLEFEFSDNYSVFDKGIMPDAIPRKGIHLAKITSFIYESFHNSNTFKKISKPQWMQQSEYNELLNTKTYKHFLQNGAKTHFHNFKIPASIIVEPVKVIKPIKFDNNYLYSEFSRMPENTLIPLEVVFRFGVPKGSSFLKRMPNLKENQFLDYIHLDFYTKLEPKDRRLSETEAKLIAGLTEDEFIEICNQTKILALCLNDLLKNTDITLWDGKFEFAFGKTINGQREIILVDSIGPDELRLTRNEFPLSKEYLRQENLKLPWTDKYINKNDNNVIPENLDQKVLNNASKIYEDIYQSLVRNNGNNVVIFGKGGREHAIADHLSKSDFIQQVFVIPGNPGMDTKKVKTISIKDNEIINFCLKNNIEFAIIGPEDLLQKGLSNALEEVGIPCAAPTQMASQLECSKAYAKNLMSKYKIPTATYEVFENRSLAINYVKEHNSEQFVVKLSGLAAGKGVIIAENKNMAIEAINKLSPNNEQIVIEEFLSGKEVSYFALCLNDKFLVLDTACDYKRLKDNNIGPNTGGMGCYSPTHWLTEEQKEEINSQIIQPTLNAMLSEDNNFKGILFVGLMMTDDGPKVLEYNTRFGDPETQTILPRLESNLYHCLRSIALNEDISFSKQMIHKKTDSSIHIVKAAKGYPGSNGEMIEKNQKITSTLKMDGASRYLYYAGIDKKDHNFYTNGGRVLGLTQLAPTIDLARSLAYENIEQISFSGEQYRKDIGL